MDSSYTAKVVYRGEAVALSFGHDCSFIYFCHRTRDRFPELERAVFKLKYTVFPDTTVYLLENEVDMRMMFRVLGRYKSDFVDVDVYCLDVSASGSESVVSDNISEETSVLLEENDFLGCYRREEPKNYLSRGWKSLIQSKGQIFEGGVKEFRLKLRMYALEVGFEYDFERNKPERVVACCKKKYSEGCNWCVKASLCRYNGFFVINELVNEHTCRCVIRLLKSKMMSSKIIKEVMLDKVREDPNKKAVDIMNDIKLDYGFDVPYRTAWYGKERAREAVLGVESESYQSLAWFCERTYETNPYSKLAVEYESETKRFQRMFVTYAAWLKGFQSCRPILCIDATFITNKYKGMLLAASAKDANFGLYPVAYAIVDSENESNWTFFLKILCEELSRYSTRKITFISDRNMGLLNAVRAVCPNAPHGFCYRHLQANLSSKFASGSYLCKRIPSLFMRCAYSRTREYFDMNFKKLKEEGGEVVELFLKDLPLETWASVFFNGERFGEMTNNLAECFNSWIKELKSLPIIELNEGIRLKSMALIASRKEESARWVTQLCPKLEKKLVDNLELGRHWTVTRSDTYIYEVQCQKYSVMVNLEGVYCSCGEWQVHGFPCSHALVVIQKHGSDVYSYVNPIFKVDKYRETYSFTINPVPTISKPVDVAQPRVLVQPPLTRRPPGRPKTQRYRSKNEVKRTIKCSRCNKYAGHNRSSCKEMI